MVKSHLRLNLKRNGIFSGFKVPLIDSNRKLTVWIYYYYFIFIYYKTIK